MLSLASVAALLFSTTVNGYFLMNVGTILQERSDPIVNPGAQAAHVHKIAGGSNFRIETTTSSLLKSECTSTKIKEDKSNYWVPQLYFQWGNGSFTDVKGDFVIYYLYSDDKGKTTPFPEDFRMLSGDPDLRTYDKDSFAQQAVTFLCLDFEGTTSHHDSIPTKICPSGIRSQINFPSCWNGKDTDSPDHKSHVAFPSGGPDSGTCKDPEYPETLPRIFIEHYWATGDFTDVVGEAMNPAQPFVFANGDPTGYGYHGDFVNGWESGTLQKVVDECNCNPYGDPQCCADKGIFTLQSNDDMDCKITHTWDERVKGTLDTLPGNNPVIAEGGKATMDTGGCQSAMLDPVYVYKGSKPDKEGEVVKEATCGSGDEDEEEEESSSAVPSSTKDAGPSSTKDAEPSSTKDAEPSSTKDTEPSSDSAIASPSVSSILIADPTSTPAPEDEEDEDEDEYCDDEEDEEESAPSSTPDSTPSTPESTPSIPESTPSSTKNAEPSSTSTPEDEDEDCDDGEEYEDDEPSSSPVEATPSSTKEATPSPTDIASPTTQVLINEPSTTASPEEDCDDDEEEYDDGEEDCEDDEASSAPEPATTSSSPEPATTDASTPTTAILVPSSSTPSPSSSEDCDDDTPSISSHSADADTYTIQTADPSTPSPVVAAVNNGASGDSAGSEETCKAGGRRFSYYSKDGSKTKRAATHHHRRRGGHLNRF